MAGSKSANIGMELDKIDLAGTIRAAVNKSGGYRGVQKAAGKKTSKRNTAILPIFLMTLGVFCFFSVILFLWGQGIVDVPFLSSRKVPRKLERYATVGPLMTSIGKDQHIKIAFQIECKNAGSKERVSEINSAIQGKFLMVLNQPDVKGILERQDYQALRPFLKKAMGGLVKKYAIKDIYFSEIIRY